MPIRGGELGGPVAFFNELGTEVVILSSLSQFMASNMEVRYVRDEDKNISFPVLDFGLMGSIQVISNYLLCITKTFLIISAIGKVLKQSI
jgi:hypothetical protein